MGDRHGAVLNKHGATESFDGVTVECAVRDREGAAGGEHGSAAVLKWVLPRAVGVAAADRDAVEEHRGNPAAGDDVKVVLVVVEKVRAIYLF